MIEKNAEQNSRKKASSCVGDTVQNSLNGETDKIIDGYSTWNLYNVKCFVMILFYSVFELLVK